jgi:hypothetical protein
MNISIEPVSKDGKEILRNLLGKTRLPSMANGQEKLLRITGAMNTLIFMFQHLSYCTTI